MCIGLLELGWQFGRTGPAADSIMIDKPAIEVRPPLANYVDEISYHQFERFTRCLLGGEVSTESLATLILL